MQANLQAQMQEAVAQGVIAGFDRLIERTKQQASEQTGRWFWGLIKGTLMRWGMVALIILSVGKMAGWQLATAVWDAILHGGDKT
jgi:hypothetical protein